MSSPNYVGDILGELGGDLGGLDDMMGMMGGMGGMGGLPSSSATSGNGEFGSSGANVGGMTINNGPTAQENMTKWIVIGVVVIVVALLWKKK
jgi:hypothetical protein